MKISVNFFWFRILIAVILFAYTSVIFREVAYAQLSADQKKTYSAGINYYDVGYSSQCSGAYGSINGEIGYTGTVEGIYNSGLQGPYIQEMFMIHLLKRMAQISGKPETDFVTKEHVIALLAFQLGEGGDSNNSSVFNPMNGGMNPESLGITDDGVWGGTGSDGRRAYPSFDIGIELYARQFLTGYQSRLGYVLGKPDSTAENFAHALTFFSDYPGNKLWAAASLDQQGYYSKELSYIKTVRNNYASRAGLVMGTKALEAVEGIYRKDLITYTDLIKDSGDGITTATGASSDYGCSTPTSSTISGDFIFYSQNADPWGSETYPGSNGSDFDSAGCGPTSYSMIAATLLQDRTITPLSFRDKLVEGGYVINGYRGATSAAAGKEIYGLNYKTISTKDEIRTALKSGSLIISGGGYGPYRFESHIIVMRAIDSNDKVTVADPEDNTPTDRFYQLDEFIKDGKYFVAVSK